MKIISGTGKEYDEVTNETIVNFMNWVEANELPLKEFDKIIQIRPKIIVKKDNSHISITINANDKNLYPFIWDKDSGIKQEYFWIDLLLILNYICNRTENEEFSKQIKNIANKYCKIKPKKHCKF